SGDRRPLTPALSRGERGDRRQSVGESALAKTSTERALLFPLPGGEGQGEGKLRIRLTVERNSAFTPTPECGLSSPQQAAKTDQTLVLVEPGDASNIAAD